MSGRVAVLYARADSNYRALDQCDVWDAERDARRWPGGVPVVAHPPCRAWGRLRAFAKPREDEKALALHAVECVRRWGGVLEQLSFAEFRRAYDLTVAHIRTASTPLVQLGKGAIAC